MYGSRPPLQRTTWHRSNDPGTSRRLEVEIGRFLLSVWLWEIFLPRLKKPYAVATFRWKFRFFFWKDTKLPLKIGHPKTKVVFQPSIFQGLIMLNFGGVELSSSWFVWPWLFSTFCWGLGDPKGKWKLIFTNHSDHKKHAQNAPIGGWLDPYAAYAFEANKPFAHERKKCESFEIALFQETSSKNISKKHQKNL